MEDFNDVNDLNDFNDGNNAINQRKDSKRILLLSGLFLSVMAIVVLVAQVVIELLSSKFFIKFYEFDGYNAVVSVISFVGIGYPIFILLMKRIPNSERRERKKLSLGKLIGFFLICIAAMYASNYIGVFISFIIASIRGVESVNPLEDMLSGSNMLVMMIYGILIAPIMEEIIFRKVLLDKLRRFGDKPAILMTGFAFGLFHMNLQQFVYATVLGMLFAYITIRTNTIRYAIIIHMIVNFIGIGIAPYVLLNESMLGTFLIFVWIIMAMTIGSVVFILNIKKIKLNKPEVPLVRKRDYIFNPGSMLFIIICAGIILLGVLFV